MRKVTKKVAVLVPLLVILVLIITGCSNNSKKTSKSNDDKQMTLKLGTMPAPDSLPVYIAQQEGYFKDENLKVDITKFQSPKERDSAISANQLDGAISDMVAFATYAQGNLNWKITSQATGYFGIITNNPNIKSVKDLKGKSYALMPSQTPQLYLSNELKKNGLSLKDLTLKEIPQIPVRVQMVQAKKVDATVVPDPFITISKKSGMRVIAQSTPENFKSTIYTFSDKTLKNNKEAVQAFYRAYDRAVDYINAHDVKDMKKVLVTDLGYKGGMIDSVSLPKYSKATEVKTDDLQKALDYSKSQKIYDKNKNPKSYLTNILK
ncbi:ABC transporter substrate-binding protein [Companilactobacillus sp. DQM5]|uniref:ABC transporter substrate-binding protein n=1 Tax=Companilactobacillus sp. DQM5 TaxID=3463359 RepID=UPI0040581DBA